MEDVFYDSSMVSMELVVPEPYMHPRLHRLTPRDLHNPAIRLLASCLPFLPLLVRHMHLVKALQACLSVIGHQQECRLRGEVGYGRIRRVRRSRIFELDPEVD